MIKSETTTREQRNDQRRQKLIGARLKHLYAEVVEEAVPDEFIALLEKAQQQRAK